MNKKNEDQDLSSNHMYAAYLEDVTPGGFGSGGHGFTPWFETKKEVQSYIDDLKSELGSFDENDSEDDDTLCVQWTGSIEDLSKDAEEQAQIVRLRFFEEIDPALIEQHFGSIDVDLTSETPPIPDGLNGDFKIWLLAGSMSFGD